jgi:signal peptidase I
MRPVEQDRRRDALRAANRTRRGLHRWRASGGRGTGSWLAVLPIALVLFLVVRTFVVEAFRIPSSSMERTLLVGDFLLVNKWVYGAEIPFTHTRLPALRAPQHDDVIVFDWPVDPDKAFVKRLVGLPGDTLRMMQGVLSRNGAVLRERYVSRGTRTGSAFDTNGDARDSWGPLVVPSRHLFVLGDNRANSLDSRYWGFVPDSLLRGAPWFVYYSFTPDSTERTPWLTRIRWARIGTTVR